MAVKVAVVAIPSSNGFIDTNTLTVPSASLNQGFAYLDSGGLDLEAEMCFRQAEEQDITGKYSRYIYSGLNQVYSPDAKSETVAFKVDWQEETKQ